MKKMRTREELSLTENPWFTSTGNVTERTNKRFEQLFLTNWPTNSNVSWNPPLVVTIVALLIIASYFPKLPLEISASHVSRLNAVDTSHIIDATNTNQLGSVCAKWLKSQWTWAISTKSQMKIETQYPPNQCTTFTGMDYRAKPGTLLEY